MAENKSIEFTVTEAMIEAGVETYCSLDEEFFTYEEIVTQTYKAMRSLEPSSEGTIAPPSQDHLKDEAQNSR